MNDPEARIKHLEQVISEMTLKAGAGLCQFSTEGKHAFLNDIKLIGEREGFDVLGIPTDPEQRKAWLAA